MAFDALNVAQLLESSAAKDSAADKVGEIVQRGPKTSSKYAAAISAAQMADYYLLCEVTSQGTLDADAVFSPNLFGSMWPL
ncbi:MAG: hypothetical protein AAF266_08490, partial [Planctomycetota bacterium]